MRQLEATPLSTVARQHAHSEPSSMLPDAAAGRTMPSAEAMTAPRLQEQRRPPSPPDRRPHRRGGRPSYKTESAAGRPAGLPRLAGARRGLVRSARVLAAVAWLSLLGALALPAPAQAQTTGICDRTQQVQDEILNRLSAVSDCAAVTDADLASVTLVVLERKSITSLEAGDFDGLTAVANIVLTENQLGALPANLFSGLTSLTNLAMDVAQAPGERLDQPVHALGRLEQDRPAVGACLLLVELGEQWLVEQIREQNSLWHSVGRHAGASVVAKMPVNTAFLPYGGSCVSTWIGPLVHDPG